MKQKAVGIGAGGHARVVLEIIQLCDRFEIVGLVDSSPNLKGSKILGAPVLGGDAMLPKLIADGIVNFFLGVGSVGDTSVRRRLYEMAMGLGLRPILVIHPQAVISNFAQLGLGATIMAAVVINACAAVGDNVIINTGAIVEHDCVIDDHVHVATGARLAGGVSVGEGSHIGLGASIRQGVRIGRRVLVGAGAVVVKDIPDNVVVAGVPARIVGESAER